MPTRSSPTRCGTSRSTSCRCPAADERQRREPGEWSDSRIEEDDVTKALSVIVAFVVVGLVGAGSAVADEAPISGTAQAIEQPLTLSDLKPGWVVSVSTKHEAGKEVAEVVKVILEK